MQGLATTQRRYDRHMPPDYDAHVDDDDDQDPLATLRVDIARDPDAAQDISTAWIDKLFDAADNNLILARLLAGDDAAALALVKHALDAVALERATRRCK